ncbi:MAG: peptidylprolyl isomerase [Bacteroidota bacterium]
MRFLALAALVFTAASAASQPVRPGTTLDGIAAVVSDQVVLLSEVDALAQQAAQGQPVSDDLWSRALDRLVEQRVVIAHARRDTTLNVTEEIVDGEVDRQVQALAAQTGGEAALEAAYGRSIAQIRQSLRADVRDEILLQQFQGRRAQGVTITPGEVREWFARIPEAERPMVPELVRVAHIVRVPAPNDAAKSAARAFAQTLRDSVTAEQATLEALADRHSMDPGNTNRDGTKNGGRYDNFRLGDLVPEFSAAAAALTPGDLSEVFESPFGFHVLRVNERRGDRVSFNHILISVETGANEVEQAREFLTVLRDSVEAGTPFEALARRHSEDPFSASRGGFVSDPQSGQRDLSVEALGDQWQATLDSLEVGDYSEPAEVRLLDGTEAVHLVWLQKRTPTHRLSIADDYALLSQYALQEKRQETLADWVRGLRRTVYVDIRADRYQPLTQS